MGDIEDIKDIYKEIRVKSAQREKKQALLDYYLELVPENVLSEAMNFDVEALNHHDKEELVATIVMMACKYIGKDAKEATADKVAELSKELNEIKVINEDLERQLSNRYPGGRKPKYTEEFKEEVRRFYNEGGQTHKSVAEHFGIGTSTVNRILNH